MGQPDGAADRHPQRRRRSAGICRNTRPPYRGRRLRDLSHGVAPGPGQRQYGNGHRQSHRYGRRHRLAEVPDLHRRQHGQLANAAAHYRRAGRRCRRRGRGPVHRAQPERPRQRHQRRLGARHRQRRQRHRRAGQQAQPDLLQQPRQRHRAQLRSASRHPAERPGRNHRRQRQHQPGRHRENRRTAGRVGQPGPHLRSGQLESAADGNARAGQRLPGQHRHHFPYGADPGCRLRRHRRASGHRGLPRRRREHRSHRVHRPAPVDRGIRQRAVHPGPAHRPRQRPHGNRGRQCGPGAPGVARRHSLADALHLHRRRQRHLEHAADRNGDAGGRQRRRRRNRHRQPCHRRLAQRDQWRHSDRRHPRRRLRGAGVRPHRRHRAPGRDHALQRAPENPAGGASPDLRGPCVRRALHGGGGHSPQQRRLEGQVRQQSHQPESHLHLEQLESTAVSGGRPLGRNGRRHYLPHHQHELLRNHRRRVCKSPRRGL